jgi:Holliday junction DNA helicase RuvA
VIARLAGRLIERDGTRGIVDVGGVGYEVFATNRAFDGWTDADAIAVYVSTQVREDAITLYGFPTDLERKAFLVLMGVSGFGPKVALAALDALGVDELHRAVEGDDFQTLGRIPGVGAKKAQRLALELKGKVPVGFDVTPRAARAPAKSADPLSLALAQLEYGRSEIERAFAGLAQNGIADDAPLDVRLKASLRILSGSPA